MERERESVLGFFSVTFQEMTTTTTTTPKSFLRVASVWAENRLATRGNSNLFLSSCNVTVAVAQLGFANFTCNEILKEIDDVRHVVLIGW